MNDGGGPAFPCTTGSDGGVAFSGMSLRDYFAAAALMGYLSCDDTRICDDDGSAIVGTKTSEVFARLAYQQADAMLAEREKP